MREDENTDFEVNIAILGITMLLVGLLRHIELVPYNYPSVDWQGQW